MSNSPPAASVPEPPPKAGEKSVTQNLLAYLEKKCATGYSYSERTKYQRKLLALIKERREYGVAKYGQELMTNDGRNSFEDARQEIGDAVHYCWKLKMMQGSTDELYELRKLFVEAISLLDFDLDAYEAEKYQ